jgi:hypothetical protein
MTEERERIVGRESDVQHWIVLDAQIFGWDYCLQWRPTFDSAVLNDCMQQLTLDPHVTACHLDPCFSQSNDLFLHGVR